MVDYNTINTDNGYVWECLAIAADIKNMDKDDDNYMDILFNVTDYLTGSEKPEYQIIDKNDDGEEIKYKIVNKNLGDTYLISINKKEYNYLGGLL